MPGTFSGLRFTSSQPITSNSVWSKRRLTGGERGLASSPSEVHYRINVSETSPHKAPGTGPAPVPSVGKWKLVSVCIYLSSRPSHKAHITRRARGTTSDHLFCWRLLAMGFCTTLVQLPSWGRLVLDLKNRTTQACNLSLNGRKRCDCLNLHSLCDPRTAA